GPACWGAVRNLRKSTAASSFSGDMVELACCVEMLYWNAADGPPIMGAGTSPANSVYSASKVGSGKVAHSNSTSGFSNVCGTAQLPFQDIATSPLTNMRKVSSMSVLSVPSTQYCDQSFRMRKVSW